MRRVELAIDECFALLTAVYRRALQDARSSNPKIAAPAQVWLDYVWPEWRIVHGNKSEAKKEDG